MSDADLVILSKSDPETIYRALVVEFGRFQVAQDEVEQLRAENESLQAQVVSLEAEKASLQEQIDGLTPQSPTEIKTAAIAELVGSTSPSTVATRATVQHIYTAINDVREAISLIVDWLETGEPHSKLAEKELISAIVKVPRVTLEIIKPQLLEAILTGQGDVLA
jgi:hypothetical protein